jgi:hypothetical protein
MRERERGREISYRRGRDAKAESKQKKLSL